MFIHRFCSMIVLLALFSLMLLNNCAGLIAYLVFGILLSFFVTKEICEIFGNIQSHTDKIFLCMANTLIFILFYLIMFTKEHPQWRVYSSLTEQCIFLLLVILFVAGLIRILRSVNDEEKLKKIVMNTFVFVFVNFPVCLITLIYFAFRSDYGCLHEHFHSFLNAGFLYFILVTKSGDIGAYAIGTLCGKLMKNGTHKMIPSVSPGKSYEGLAGGILTSVALSCILCSVFEIRALSDHWVLPVLGGLVLYFGGMIGDLVESSIKRTCKVKDSGRLIPGIGGVYDLLDSLFFSAPCYLLFLAAVNLVRNIL